jgi:hypothetical protein
VGANRAIAIAIAINLKSAERFIMIIDIINPQTGMLESCILEFQGELEVSEYKLLTIRVRELES